MQNKIKNKKQLALIVLDGWGYREDPKNNAVAAAKTPNFNKLWNEFPHTLLEASGEAVGLPEGQMGNSEVGHSTIGAGTIIYQDLVRIKKSIDTNGFETNPAFLEIFNHVKKHDSTLHLLGMLSDGGVHSHKDHLFALLRACKFVGVNKVAIHVITDGRDAPPQNATMYLKELEDEIERIGVGFIASISGRSFTMDRDKNWNRTERAHNTIFNCHGNICTIKPSEYVRNLYEQNLGKYSLDEHIVPFVIKNGMFTGAQVMTHDGFLFWNFRSDRARQISEKILEKKNQYDLCFATMTEFDPNYEKNHGAFVAFPKKVIVTTLAKVISEAGLTQAHIAETEKFPHATYFLNGGVETLYMGEKHIMLESRKDVPTHDLAPKMRAEGIADKAIEEIEAGTDFIFINFANPDMVGHTANVRAIIEAVEETDLQLGRVLATFQTNGGVAFVTADHGNAEVNIDEVSGEKHTSHTINPVPAIFTDQEYSLKTGSLADIAPTVLSYFGLNVPEAMTGNNLLHK